MTNIKSQLSLPVTFCEKWEVHLDAVDFKVMLIVAWTPAQ